MNTNQPRGRGLASADPQTRARVASAGGKAVSQDREHMRSIGRAGGRNSHASQRQDREQ